MECNYCLSTEYEIRPDFTFECKFCLSDRQIPVMEDFIRDFSSAYLNSDNLSNVINQYYEVAKDFTFPFIIRDYVQADFNYNLIAKEIRLLPDFEANIIKKITSSNVRVGFDFGRSSELLNQIIVNQDNLPDLLTRLELLAIMIANEEGSIRYNSTTDLEYIYMDPKASVIVQSFIKSLKNLSAKSQKLAKPLIEELGQRIKLQTKYLEECSPPSKFEYSKLDSGLAITKCNDQSKILRIPPIIHGEIVISIHSKAFTSLKAEIIEIPLTVQEIQIDSFIDLKYLSLFKLGNQTSFSPRIFLNCPNLNRIELLASHKYVNDEGIIYSANKRNLIYLPAALQKSELIIDGAIKIQSYSCYYSRYLRDVDLSIDTVVEANAFRIDEHSALTPRSKKQINKVLQGERKNASKSSAEVTDKKAETNNIDDFLISIKFESDDDKKLNLLLEVLDKANNYLQKASILDEILLLPEGPESILRLKIEEPYLLYYRAMSDIKTKSNDKEKTLQYFLDSYNAGNQKAGINAATLLKNATAGVQDLTLAERILVDLSSKNNLQAKLRLVSFYNEFPNLCTSDIHPIITDLESKILDEFTPLYADILYKGQIIPKDKIKAISLMEKLSDNGDMKMSYQLGYIYYSDDEVKDLNKSISYFNKAHIQGHKDAKRAILKIQQ